MKLYHRTMQAYYSLMIRSLVVDSKQGDRIYRKYFTRYMYHLHKGERLQTRE